MGRQYDTVYRSVVIEIEMKYDIDKVIGMEKVLTSVGHDDSAFGYFLLLCEGLITIGIGRKTLIFVK